MVNYAARFFQRLKLRGHVRRVTKWTVNLEPFTQLPCNGSVMFMMLLKIVSLCLLVGVHHVCANERPMPGLSFRDVDLIRTISQDTMQLEASNATDIGSSETFASSLVENYSFSAYQILRGIDYDTYMTNSKINNVVLQKSIVNGLNSLLKMFPVENLVLSPDDIAIYDVRSTFVYTSQSQTEEAAGNNVLISYFVNCKIPSDIYVSPDALYSALKASINTYRADESVSGLTSILQATAEIYGAVNLTTVISSSVGYPCKTIFTSFVECSTCSSQCLYFYGLFQWSSKSNMGHRKVRHHRPWMNQRFLKGSGIL